MRNYINRSREPGAPPEVAGSFTEDEAIRAGMIEAFKAWTRIRRCGKCGNPTVDDTHSSAEGLALIKRCIVCGWQSVAPELPKGLSLREAQTRVPTRAQREGATTGLRRCKCPCRRLLGELSKGDYVKGHEPKKLPGYLVRKIRDLREADWNVRAIAKRLKISQGDVMGALDE